MRDIIKKVRFPPKKVKFANLPRLKSHETSSSSIYSRDSDGRIYSTSTLACQEDEDEVGQRNKRAMMHKLFDTFTITGAVYEDEKVYRTICHDTTFTRQGPWRSGCERQSCRYTTFTFRCGHWQRPSASDQFDHAPNCPACYCPNARCARLQVISEYVKVDMNCGKCDMIVGEQEVTHCISDDCKSVTLSTAETLASSKTCYHVDEQLDMHDSRQAEESREQAIRFHSVMERLHAAFGPEFCLYNNTAPWPRLVQSTADIAALGTGTSRRISSTASWVREAFD